MYILNEKEYIEEIISSKEKPENLTLWKLICLVSRYLYDFKYENECKENIMENEKKEKTISSTSISNFVAEVINTINSFNLDYFEGYKYLNTIRKICRDICIYDKYKFKNEKCVYIYESDIYVINSLNTIREKKLLFTMYAIARYVDYDGWINKKDSKSISEVFKMANVTATIKQQNEMLRILHSYGVIDFCQKIDNRNIKLHFFESNPTCNSTCKITNFTNLGNQYLANFQDGYKQCECCGKAIKCTGNRKKYCSNCAAEREKERKKIQAKSARNTIL